MNIRNFMIGVGHSLSWLFSPSGDVEILNPNFRGGVHDKELTIECIHGLADDSHAFRWMAEIIKYVLPDSVRCIRLLSYEKRNQNTLTDAKQIVSKILKHQDKNVVFLAHSHGGLAASTLIEELSHDLKDKANINILGAIILGTPLYGADLAVWPLTFFMPSVAEMHRDSKLLHVLRGKMKLRMQAQKDFYHTIGFGKDALVKNSSVCLDPKSHIEIPHTSHLACLYDYHTIRALLIMLYIICGPFTGPKRALNSKREIKIQDNSLLEVILKIRHQIKELNSRIHIESVKDKEKVLLNLCEILEAMYVTGINCLYPKKQTLGEFLETYLYDMNYINAPYLILRRPKNFSNKTIPTSLTFMENLIEEYYDVALNLGNPNIKVVDEDKPHNSLKI